MHVELFEDDPEKVDLLICDEAHRLKNNETLTSKSLNVLACRRRVLLSGTPMQNKLDEFYAMVDFTNPGILGKIEQFRRRFVRPIECGREPGCTEKEEKLGRRFIPAFPSHRSHNAHSILQRNHIFYLASRSKIN